jgi:protein phosphatase/serine/threonine-protein phosphatase Stp1
MNVTDQIRFSATTHVGLKRKINEDSLLALADQKLWIVADGMGGHTGGDYASQTVVDNVAIMDLNQSPGEMMVSLRHAIMSAHATIRAEAKSRGDIMMGATVVTLMVANGHFTAFWAGDSRLYRLESGILEMLTNDHSIVAELVLAGQLTWDEAEGHPQSNAITRAVGVGDVLELDKIRGEITPGTRFLLCSDGLTKYADTATLERVLGHEPIETVTDTLLHIALDGGGADNISIIVIDVI